MANQSELGLIFSISADPAKAQEAIATLGSSAKAEGRELAQINETLGTSYRTLAQAAKESNGSIRTAQQLYQAVGASARKAQTEIAAAYGSLSLKGSVVDMSKATAAERSQLRIIQEISANYSEARVAARKYAEAAAAGSQMHMREAQKELAETEAYNYKIAQLGSEYRLMAASSADASAQQAAAARQSSQVVVDAAAEQKAALRDTQDGVLQLRNGMTALGEVSRKSLDAEPVIVYGTATKQAAAASAEWEKAADAELATLRASQAARGGASRDLRSMAMAHREEAAAAMTDGDRIIMLRRQYAALAAEVKKGQGMPFLSSAEAEGLRTDRQLMADIRTEAGAMGATIQDAGERGAQGIMASISNLREFRMIMYSTLGLISFGFYITEWKRVVDAIRDGVRWMEGFDSASEKALQDLIKGSQQALVAFQGLTTQQKIWQAQQLIQQTQQRINFDIAARQAIEAQSYWHNLGTEVRGVIDALSGNSTTLAMFFSQFGTKSDVLKDELQQTALLAKQEKELGSLEKQLQQQQKGHAHAAKDAAQSEKSLQEIIATARPHLPPYIAEINRLRAALQHADSGIANTTDLLKQQIEWAQRGLPTLRQLGFALNPAAASQAAGAGAPLLTAAQSAQGSALPVLRSTKEIQAAMRAQQEAYRRTAQIARESFSVMGEAVGQYGGTFGRVFSQVSRIVELMINLHRLESVSAVQAASAKAAGQTAAIGKVSLVKSVFETAEGIAALARLDLRAAGLHFASSAKFLTVLGTVASAAGAFSSMGAGTSGSAAVASAAGAGSSGGAQGPTPGPLTPKSDSAQPQNNVLQVVFKGPVYGGPAGVKEIISNINEAVVQQRVKLNASHTITGRRLS